MEETKIEINYRALDWYRFEIFKMYRIGKLLPVISLIGILLGILEIILDNITGYYLIQVAILNFALLILIWIKLYVLHKRNKTNTHKYLVALTNENIEVDLNERRHRIGLNEVLQLYVAKNFIYFKMDNKNGILVMNRKNNKEVFKRFRDNAITIIGTAKVRSFR